MKKKILALIICFLMIITLTGCGKKTAISTTKFKSVAASHNLIVEDVKSQFEDYEDILEATIAANDNEGWQVEFYVLTTDDNAKNMYDYNKTRFEDSKTNTAVQTQKTTTDYDFYELTSAGKYMYVCRIKNTFLYVSVKDTNKTTVKKLVKELGY